MGKPKARRRAGPPTNGRQRVAAVLTAPVVVGGLAGGAAQQLVITGSGQLAKGIQQIIQAVTAARQDTMVGVGGDDFYLAGEWASANMSSQQRSAAVDLAAQVVHLATEKACVTDISPEFRRRLVQWILAGSLDPRQAAEISVDGAEAADLAPLVDQIRILTDILADILPILSVASRLRVSNHAASRRRPGVQEGPDSG
jgi:hypothetical protein